MKKGSQQTRNVPVTMASVLAAFRSRLSSCFSLARRRAAAMLVCNMAADRFAPLSPPPPSSSSEHGGTARYGRRQPVAVEEPSEERRHNRHRTLVRFRRVRVQILVDVDDVGGWRSGARSRQDDGTGVADCRRSAELLSGFALGVVNIIHIVL